MGNFGARARAVAVVVIVAAHVARAAPPHPKLSLAGGHANVTCATCHDRGNNKPPSKGSTCISCHADRHSGEFSTRAGGDCAGCHSVMGFAPTTFGAAAHATTGYALDGKHAATPCSACHTGGKPHLNWQLGQTECLDCHDNPHGTQYATEMTTGGCAHCHTAADWNAIKTPHPTWQLTGAHARTACAACHVGVAAGAPPSAFRGLPRTCEGCHDDTHAGQFRQAAPMKTCTDCHATETWKTPRFDHAKTRYPLEGVHVGMACAACHPKVELRNGTSAVRWRLGYAQCKDCHADPHPKSAAALDCSGCHAATSWKVTAGGGAGFDHDRAGFPLRGAHVQTACDGCHTGKSAKPATTCESCHRDPHQGRMDGACAECHTAVAWADTATLEQHRRTRMPLTGRHAVIECNACHVRQSPDRKYTDLPTACFACHRDDYVGAHPSHTGDPNDPSVQPYPRDCGLCHRTTTWAEAVVDPSTVIDTARTRSEHDGWFVLTSGSHRTAECAACHTDASRQRAVRCDGCHQDVALRGEHRGRAVPLAASACLRCHPQGARR